MTEKRSAPSRNSLQILAPENLTAAIKEAATRGMQTTSEYARQALIGKLRADGIDPASFVPPARERAHAA
jgi:hypothetical protein